MAKQRLALRLTLNSVVMLLLVYFIIQSTSYFRDNVMLGIYDLSAFFPTVLGFILYSVIPPMAVFSVVIYLAALRFERTLHKLEAGEVLDAAHLEKTRKDILGFSRLVLGVNLAGFVLGYVLSQVATGKADQIVSYSGLLILASNIAGGFVYAQAQSSLNNMAFARLRELLGIRDLGNRRREMRSTLKQVIYTALLGFYVVSFVQFSLHDLFVYKGYESTVLTRVARGEIPAADAGTAYHELLKKELYNVTTRTGIDVDSIPLPWERPDTFAKQETVAFYLLGFCTLLMLVMIQVTWSLDRREQINALMQRLRDVVAGGGDLRKRINLRSTDDIGELTDLINQVLRQFEEVVRRISASTIQTRESAEAIARVMDQSKSVVDQTSRTFQSLRTDLSRQTGEARGLINVLNSFRTAAAGVDEAVEQQRGFVTEASAAMEEMASNIESVESMTSKAGDLTVRLAGRGSEGQATVGETTQAMSEIQEATGGVMSVLDVLGKISASTNLLAMNAAIEAAHAGDQGKGFAVVAEEVRNLANSSATQTKQIRSLIKTMNDRVRKGVGATGSSADLLRNLVGGLQEAADISTQISRAMKEQALGTRSAADTLVQIVQASGTIHQRVEDQSREAQTMQSALEDTIHRLEQLVADSQAQTASIQALEQAFQAIGKEVEKNLSTVHDLSSQTSRFTTD